MIHEQPQGEFMSPYQQSVWTPSGIVSPQEQQQQQQQQFDLDVSFSLYTSYYLYILITIL